MFPPCLDLPGVIHAEAPTPQQAVETLLALNEDAANEVWTGWENWDNWYGGGKWNPWLISSMFLLVIFEISILKYNCVVVSDG